MPHLGAVWAHHLLSDFQKDLMSASTIYFETVLPLLVYFPDRGFRRLSFILQGFLMIGIAMTGNYNFFTFLTIVIGLSVLDDIDITEFTQHPFAWMIGKRYEDKSGRNNQRKYLWTVNIRKSAISLSFWPLNAFLFQNIFLLISPELQVNTDYRQALLSFITPSNINALLAAVLLSVFWRIFRAFQEDIQKKKAFCCFVGSSFDFLFAVGKIDLRRSLLCFLYRQPARLHAIARP